MQSTGSGTKLLERSWTLSPCNWVPLCWSPHHWARGSALWDDTFLRGRLWLWLAPVLLTASVTVSGWGPGKDSRFAGGLCYWTSVLVMDIKRHFYQYIQYRALFSLVCSLITSLLHIELFGFKTKLLIYKSCPKHCIQFCESHCISLTICMLHYISHCHK